MPIAKVPKLVARVKKNRDYLFLGESIPPASRKIIEIEGAKLYTSSPLSIPIEVINGYYEGPVLMVNAAIHGDELNGIEIIRRLLSQPNFKLIRGTLIAVSMVNVYGVVNQSRYMPDRRDLNRCFPGSAKGSLAGRVANIFLKEILWGITFDFLYEHYLSSAFFFPY